MQCLEANIQTTKQQLGEKTKNAFSTLQAKFTKIARALLPTYDIHLIACDEGAATEANRATRGQDKRVHDLTGLQFSVNGIVGGTQELSGGVLHLARRNEIRT